MKILIRMDAYPGVGLGHFIRCLAIAEELRNSPGIEVVFAGNYSEDNSRILKKKKFDYLHSSGEADPAFSKAAVEYFRPDVIFIDNLFNYRAEELSLLRKKSRLILFHNLCEGRFCCDDFILPSVHHPSKILEDVKWKQNKVNFFHGFDYIPLNPEVIRWKSKYADRKEIFRVAITTGGSDPEGIMNRVLSWIADAGFPGTEFIALPGSSFMHKEDLFTMALEFHKNIKIKDFDYRWLASSDLVISTFGVTSYELIYLQKPVISLAHALSNARGSRILSEKLENFKDLGLATDCSHKQFINLLKDAIEARKNAGINDLVYKLSPDGKGTERIARIIRGTYKIKNHEE